MKNQLQSEREKNSSKVLKHDSSVISTNNNNINKESARKEEKQSKQSQKKSQPKDKNLNEKDVDKKVEDYKQTLNQELLKLLSVEKEREIERKALYEKAEGEEAKKKVEADMKEERNKAAEHVMKLNE